MKKEEMIEMLYKVSERRKMLCEKNVDNSFYGAYVKNYKNIINIIDDIEVYGENYTEKDVFALVLAYV